MQVNHADIVQQLYNQQPAEKSIPGALAFCLRVLAALPPSEKAGLLVKTSGDNIIPFRDTVVSAGRICYPDGQLYKVLTDVPTTNGPQWSDNGTVDPSLYLSVADQPTPAPIPPQPPSGDLSDVIKKLTDMAATLAALSQTVDTNENMATLRHADMSAHFDEIKRIMASPPHLHMDGSVKVFGASAPVSLDSKP